jgi:GTP cyclohydrolase II
MALTQLPIQDLLAENKEHACEGCGEEGVCVRIVSIAELPTRFGDFQIVAFENNKDGKDHIAIVRGDVTGAENVAVRLHSECLTGDALGSLRCDCRDQLEAALTAIGRLERGIVLYLRQEGRGIGLKNKIRAYALQDYGMDTVEANLALGFRDDERDYAVAAHMLASLKVKSIQLMTNNPRKINDLQRLGVNVAGRLPHILPANPHNEFYLRTKAEKSGHMFDLRDFKGKSHLQEQSDRPVVKGMTEKQVQALQD